MIPLHFEPIYSTAARWEPCSIALPLPQGALMSPRAVRVRTETGDPVPTQARATALHPDGSVKWLFARFMANIPPLRAVDYALDLNAPDAPLPPLEATAAGASTGELRFTLATAEDVLFTDIHYGSITYTSEVLTAPQLETADGTRYTHRLDRWELIETGEVCAIWKGSGWYCRGDERVYQSEIKLACYRGKPWLELACRLINTTAQPLPVKRLELRHNHAYAPDARCAVGVSNYKTRYDFSTSDAPAHKVIDDQYLLYDANEHNAEVFYGTFLADCADASGGLCATIYQAHQNFPKALTADPTGISVQLVPAGAGSVTLQPGMAREQRILLDFHGPEAALSDLSDTSTRYQMPQRPSVPPEVFARSGIIEPVFTDAPLTEVEMLIQTAADGHARCYGMLNWGDAPDEGYTAQGRGGGEPVWTNNEYDFPHACALLYMRTGTRRYLDYLLVSARHWLDVDICHYSDDPLLLHGQWEHTNRHSFHGQICCSHQWVEGLLDYYHFTGDPDALQAALDIGEVDLRLLATPAFQNPGELNARETGWALRTLVALYRETGDERWLERCDWIVGHFEEWEQKYGHWLSPYTDNTHIRVVFMIAVAAASLMRYHRVRPQEKIRGMILRAVDDLLDNARLDNGLFYYKQLPSLSRFGNNPIVLEALAIAHELTGDPKYLLAGLPTFRWNFGRNRFASAVGGGKKSVGDAVITGGQGTKHFAQMMIPFTTYYVACAQAGVLTEADLR